MRHPEPASGSVYRPPAFSTPSAPPLTYTFKLIGSCPKDSTELLYSSPEKPLVVSINHGAPSPVARFRRNPSELGRGVPFLSPTVLGAQ